MLSFRRVVRQQWQFIVATLLVTLLVAGGVTLLMPRTYRASAQMFVTAESEAGPFAASQFAQDQVRSYAEIVNSPTVISPVIEELQLDETPEDLGERITAEVPVDTAVLNVFVEDSSAERAAQIANAMSEQLRLLATELQTPEGETTALVEVTIVKPAPVPDAPEFPQPVNNLLLALILGLGLGLGLAVMRANRDSVPAFPEPQRAARSVTDPDAAPGAARSF